MLCLTHAWGCTCYQVDFKQIIQGMRHIYDTYDADESGGSVEDQISSQYADTNPLSDKK